MGWITRVESSASEREGKGTRYRANWRDPSGQKRARTLSTLKEARSFLASVEGDKVRGAYVDPRAGRVRLSDYIEQYTASQRHWKETTRAQIESHLNNHVVPVLGNRPLDAIRRSEIQAWANALADRLAPSTVRHAHGLLAMVFRSAIRDGLLIRTPCDRISLPAVQRTAIKIVTPQQVNALTQAMHPRFRALIPLGVGTGLRPGEMFGLRVTRVDWLRREIRVEEQVQTLAKVGPVFQTLKTSSSRRTVPAPAFVLEALSQHLAQFPSDDVIFTMPQGGLISRTRFHARYWTPARKAAGLPESITPHCLRHTYVAGLIAKGMHPRAIQALAGHESIKTTMDTYGHLFPDVNERASAALDELFGTAMAAPPADKVPTNRPLKIVNDAGTGL